MKTIVITGASRGIGLASAKKFLTEGWRIIGTYLDTPVPLTDKNLSIIRFDQGDSKSIASAAKEIENMAPGIDAIVNCAGIILDAHDTKANLKKIRKTIEVNLFGIMGVKNDAGTVNDGIYA